MFQFRRGLALCLLIGNAAPAAAQGLPAVPCAQPTLAQCQSPRWLALTSCGRRERAAMRVDSNAACNQRLGEAARQAAAGMPVQRVLAPESLGGAPTDARVPVVSHVGREVEGTAEAFQGGVTSTAATASATGALPPAEVAKRQIWAQNGNRIQSCEEYVYEKYLDYTLFEDAAAPRIDRLRSVVELAYGPAADPAAIGTRHQAGQPLRGRDLRALPAQLSPNGVMPRNVYYTVPDDVFETNPDLAPLRVVVQDGRARPYAESFGWHRQMFDRQRAAGVIDDQFRQIDDARQRFQGLLADRMRVLSVMEMAASRSDAAIAGYEACLARLHSMPMDIPGGGFLPDGGGFGPGGGLPGMPPGGGAFELAECQAEMEEALAPIRMELGELEAQRIALETSLGTELRAAQGMGCLDLASSRCDWTPRLFMDRLGGRIQAAREADFARCRALTGDDFGPLAARVLLEPGTAVGMDFSPRDGRPDPAQDFTLDTARLEAYFARVSEWQRRTATWAATQVQAASAIARDLVDPVTGQLTAPAKRMADEGQAGNDDFNVGYAYSLGVAVTDFEDDLCDAQATADASFQAYGTAFGRRQELVDAAAALGREGLDLHFRVVGQDVVQPIADGHFNIVRDSVERSANFVDVRATFPVVGFPVTVRGGIGGRIGLNYELGEDVGTRPDDCAEAAFGLRGRVEPFAEVNAFAEAGIDLVIVEVGVKAALVLLQASIPFSAQVAFTSPTSSVQSLRFDLDASAQLDLRALDGKISLYLEVDLVFWSDRFDVELFSWNGLRWSWNLFRLHYGAPLFGVAQLLADQG